MAAVLMAKGCSACVPRAEGCSASLPASSVSLAHPSWHKLEIVLLGSLGVKFGTMYASQEGPRKRRMQRVTDEREEIQSLWSLSGLLGTTPSHPPS